MRLRTVLLATTLLTAAGLAQAEPLRLDIGDLDGVTAGRLRRFAGAASTQGSAFAAGPVARAQTDAATTTVSDGRTAKMSAFTRSRAGVALWPR